MTNHLTCIGACKTQRTRDFTPWVFVLGERYWMFTLHDTLECPDRVRWRMNSLMEKAAALRETRG